MPNRILSNAALFRVVVFISFTWLVSACGGGGGGSRTPDDTTPTAFSFAAQSDVALETEVTSAEVTILGINTETPVSITGGEVSINGGSFGTTGSINVDQTIEVRLTSSSDFEITTEATIDVGGVTATFSVTTFEQDIEPEAFTFEAVTDVEISSEQTSEVTITDINDAAAISIVDGEYSIDGGDFTDEAGTVENDSTVVVRLNASAEFSTEAELTLSVGDVSAVFSVETEVLDITPEAFVFAAAADITPSEVTESASITVTSINAPAAISVVNGEFSINGADFTADPATVTNGQTVTVRATAPATPQTELDVALTIGDVSGTFNITTLTDDTPPTALIAFPPPASMTEGTTVFIRGTAEDDFSVITGVSVVTGETSVVATDTSEEGDFSSWEAIVTLAEGENTLTVEATDSSENVLAEAGPSVNIRHDPTFGNFPNSDEVFRSPRSIFLDEERNQMFVGSGSNEQAFNLAKVDLLSGERSLIPSLSAVFEEETGDITSVLVSENGEKLWVTDSLLDDISEVDVETGERTIILDSMSSTYSLSSARAMVFGAGPDTNLVFVDQDNDLIGSLDVANGEVTLISSSSEELGLIPLNDVSNPILFPRALAFDNIRNRYLVSDLTCGCILTVNPQTGVRSVLIEDSDSFNASGVSSMFYDAVTDTIFMSGAFGTSSVFSLSLEDNSIVLLSSDVQPNATNALGRPFGVALSANREYLYVADEDAEAIFAVDLVNGYRVVITRGGDLN